MKIKRANEAEPNLGPFIQSVKKTYVCGYDRWGDDDMQEGFCARCGREITYYGLANHYEEIICLLCDPYITEN